VAEVTLQPGGEAPRWQGGRLEAAELASLLGEAPPPTEPEPEPEPEPEQSSTLEPAAEALTEAEPTIEPEPATELGVKDLANSEAAPPDPLSPPESPNQSSIAAAPLDRSMTP
jgi:hypothetical protein